MDFSWLRFPVLAPSGRWVILSRLWPIGLESSSMLGTHGTRSHKKVIQTLCPCRLKQQKLSFSMRPARYASHIPSRQAVSLVSFLSRMQTVVHAASITLRARCTMHDQALALLQLCDSTSLYGFGEYATASQKASVRPSPPQPSALPDVPVCIDTEWPHV